MNFSIISPKCLFSFFLLQLNRRIKIRHIKKVTDLISNNLFLSKIILDQDYRMRYPHLEKNITFELAHFVVFNVFFKGLPELDKVKDFKFYKEHKEKIEAETELAQTNTSFLESYKLHLELRRYLLRDSKLSLPNNPYNQKIMEANLLSESEFQEQRNVILKSYKKTKKEFRKEYKLDKEIKELEKFDKFELTSERISTLIALISVLFLSTGFMYNIIYLQYFGIDLSKYFNISDYLSTSADKIFYSVVSIGFTFLMIFIMFPEYIRGELPQTSPKTNFGRKFLNAISLTIIPILFLACIFNYIKQNALNFYSSLQGLSFFILVLLLLRILKYFKNPARAYIFLSAILILITSISFNAMKDIHHIINDDIHEIKKYKVIFESNKLNVDEKNLILLASNSNWFFFYDKDTKKTKIIPAKEILTVENTIVESYWYDFFIQHFQKEKLNNKHPITEQY